MTNSNLLFLKLGGSLITDKDRPHTPRRRLICRIMQEIKETLLENPQLSLLLGHGSGSFAHVPAAKYGTRGGVNNPEDWQGFLEVWREARALHLIVMEECARAGLPVISFPPSAVLLSDGRKAEVAGLPLIQSALNAHLIPVVYGDVVFDRQMGGTIFSTEEVFLSLMDALKPARILLAGRERGVYQDFAARRQVIGALTPESYKMNQTSAGGSASIDVTGGMQKKVELMVRLVKDYPELSVQIFSGRRPGVIKKALLGGRPGTRICSKI